MKKSMGLLLALCALLVVVGCGAGDDAIKGGDVSKEDYIVEANEICDNARGELEAAGDDRFRDLDPGEQPSDAEKQAFVEEEVVPKIQDQIDQLRDLEAPEDDVDQLEELYDTLQEELDALADDPVGGFDKPFESANQLAGGYGAGLLVCNPGSLGPARAA